MSVLDDPIWSSLNGAHAALAEGDKLARRYPPEIGPLTGLESQSGECYARLAELMGPDDVAVQFLPEDAPVPEVWTVVRRIVMYQMVCAAPPGAPRRTDFVALSKDDVPEMLALAKVTLPGPFRSRTIELGGYVGFKEGGKLAAMAGYRTRPDGHVEISAVATHPDFQGRGLAKALVAKLAQDVYDAGKTPMLGVRDDNANAIGLYKSLGFAPRVKQAVLALKRPR